MQVPSHLLREPHARRRLALLVQKEKKAGKVGKEDMAAQLVNLMKWQLPYSMERMSGAAVTALLLRAGCAVPLWES